MTRPLCMCALAALSFLSGVTRAASSDFSTGSDGWLAVGDSQGPLTWSATGGNPGGTVSIADSVLGGVTYFVAPSAFLGNDSAAVGTSLRFDLRQVYPGSANQFDSNDVVLSGASLTLAYDTPNNPANGAWTSYSVPLVASAWHLNTTSGGAVSDAQFAAVMANLTSLQIRAEYQTGPDTGSLDNVSLAAAVPEPSSLALMLSGLACGLWAMRRRR